MGEFAVGQHVTRFEDPRLLRGGGRYTDDIQLPGMAHGVVLRSPHAHAKIKSIDTKAAKAAPGVLCVLTAADVKAAGFTELPVPGGLKRRDGSPQYRAALSDPGRRPRALGRRSCRLRGGGNARAGDGRRRDDRGRLRTVACRHFDRAGAAAGLAARMGRLPGQYLLRRADRRQGRGRGCLRQGRACGEGQVHHQPRHRRHHGAARRGRRLQRGRPPLHRLHADAAPAPDPRRARQGDEGAGEQAAHRHRRHRRLVRHEIAGVQRDAAGAARLQAHRPAGEMDLDAQRSLHERRAGARQRHRG